MAIDSDDKLSGVQKADALKKVAEQQAADRARAVDAKADRVAAEQKKRDDADREAAVKAIDPDLSDADKAARKKEIDDRFAERQVEREKVAEVERTRRDAAIQADASLTPDQRTRQLKESETRFQTEQKAAQAEHDAASKELSALLTPAEKAAEDAAAAKATGEGDRVKNPYALSARLKPHLVKAQRWKQVVTSFGLHVDTTRPPVPPEEEDPATLVDLLGLARQFQAADQPVALRLLREPSVQNAAAIGAAVDALREEARATLLSDIRESVTGQAQGVMTVSQQREFLSRNGIDIPADLPSAEVTRRFNAHLDTAVARLQPDDQQKAAILKAIGIEPAKDQTVAQAYDKALSDGQLKARESAKRIGLSPAQTDALLSQMTP